MNDHVSSDIADLLAGRLSPESELELKRHIEACPDCAAEVAFARRFVESALEQGLAHVRPERIGTLAEHFGSATPAERRHVETCDTCRAELDWARKTTEGVVPRLSEPREVEAPRVGTAPRVGAAPRKLHVRPRVWITAAAGLAAMLAVVFLARPPQRPEPTSYADLIVAAPLPVRIPRSTAPDDSFAVARQRGLEAYGEGNYVAARDGFDEALALRADDPEVLLYAGSARLLVGDAAGAAPLLEQGLQSADTDALRAELSWQLADARLELGDAEAARSLLEPLARQNSDYTGAAQRVIEKLQ